MTFASKKKIDLRKLKIMFQKLSKNTLLISIQLHNHYLKILLTLTKFLLHAF